MKWTKMRQISIPQKVLGRHKKLITCKSSTSLKNSFTSQAQIIKALLFLMGYDCLKVAG